MAVLTEVAVVVRLIVKKNDDGVVRVYADGVSKDADGHTIRRTNTIDITDDLTGAQQTGSANVLTAAENRLKTLWDIT